MGYVGEVFDVGMVATREEGYSTCSSDRIAPLNNSSFPDRSLDVEGALKLEEEGLALAFVEIKTRVAASTFGESATLSNADLIRCDVEDDFFRKYVPREHMGQLLHQLLVLGFGLAP